MNILDGKVEIVQHLIAYSFEEAGTLVQFRLFLGFLDELLAQSLNGAVDQSDDCGLLVLAGERLVRELAEHQKRVDSDNQGTGEQVFPRDFKGEVFDGRISDDDGQPQMAEKVSLQS